MMSVNLATLPEINFAPQSASEVEAAIITRYEQIRGVTLQPGDPERLFLESLAYFISVQNVAWGNCYRQDSRHIILEPSGFSIISGSKKLSRIFRLVL